MISHKRKHAYLWALLFVAVAHLQISSAAKAKCIQCDSGADPKCITDVASFEAKECPNESDICYTGKDGNGKITRGCKSDACSEPACYKCSTQGDGCNKHSICKSCKSSTDGEKDCAQSDPSDAKFNAVCPAADVKCIININTDKQTERRCATAEDLKDCTGDKSTCKLCTGNNCNIGIFPTDRKRCYQCDSSTTKCGDVNGNTDMKSIPCLLYNADELCYSYGTSETAMTRGCVSDVNADINKCKTPKDNPQCITCNTDNCNNLKYKNPQTLKCLQCTSSKEDTKCLLNQEPSEAKNCAKDLLYNQQGLCYTQTKDGILQRGCFYDREDSQGECKAETHCEQCGDKDGCNSKAMDFTCIRCRSDLDTKCWNDAASMNGSACRNAVTGEKDKTCFHGIWNRNAIRGCLVDADERMKAVCQDSNNKQCVTCTSTDCNNGRSAGVTTYTYFSVTILAAILLAQLFIN